MAWVCLMTWRRRLIGLGILAVAIIFLVVKLRPATTPTRVAGGFADGPFGPFAGYVWLGRVHSVSATFTVPRIRPGSPLGGAGTWIGAQGQGPPARFVQIGALEDRIPLPRTGKLVDEYYTFWSDTTKRSRAQRLFPVDPGDTLNASLTLAHHRWTLAITDTASAKTSRFSIANEVHGPFDQAEWTQEDPGLPSKHAPYPDIQAPVFRALSVNSSPPARTKSSLFSTTWMSVKGGVLAPTVVSDDAFTLRRAPAVSAEAKQYIRLTAVRIAAAQRFEMALKSWTPKTDYAAILNTSLQLIHATRQSDRAMLSARWGVHIRGLVRSATAADAGLLERVRPPSILTAETFSSWTTALTETARRGTAGPKLRLALGLPGFGLSGEAEPH